MILVGVSRSGKTPTCLYMALQYGVFAANYPSHRGRSRIRALPTSLCAPTAQALRPHDRARAPAADPQRTAAGQPLRHPRRSAVRGARCRGAVPPTWHSHSTPPSARSRKSRAASSIARASSAAFAPENSTHRSVKCIAQGGRGVRRAVLYSNHGRRSAVAVSWRSRPGTFVSLMTLYESNYIRLRWILSAPEAARGHQVSDAPGDVGLHLQVLERCRFTTTLEIELSAGEQQGAGCHARYAAAGVSRCAARRSVQLHGVAARGGASATARTHARSGRHAPRDGRALARNMLLNKGWNIVPNVAIDSKPRAHTNEGMRCSVLTAERQAHIAHDALK